MSAPRLAPPLAISEIAAMAGWSRERTLAFLKKLNAEVNGALLIPSGGKTNRRYLVHLSTLQRAVPQMFEQVRNVEADLEEQAERIETLETRLQQAAQAIGAAHRELAMLRSRTRAA